MIIEILKIFALVALQNASFTLVSRALNSQSLLYHTLASIASNGIWLLVLRQVVINLDKPVLLWTYLVAAVIGSISMHYVAMKWFEKSKEKLPLLGKLLANSGKHAYANLRKGDKERPSIKDTSKQNT